MRRGQKRRSQPWRAGSENANVRAGQADSTLESLLVNFMALPDNSTVMVTDTVMAVADSVYTALRPMLAASPSGQMIALTTPYGRRGWFYEAWEFSTGWQRTTITARDCPHITEEFLAEEREGMSEWQFRAEYLCEFTDTDEAFFSSELCDAMVDNTLEAWA